jgi:hypothetical protein
MAAGDFPQRNEWRGEKQPSLSSLFWPKNLSLQLAMGIERKRRRSGGTAAQAQALVQHIQP